MAVLWTAIRQNFLISAKSLPGKITQESAARCRRASVLDSLIALPVYICPLVIFAGRRAPRQ